MKSGTLITPTPTIEWTEGRVRLIDQTKLPLEEEYIETDDYSTVCDAILRLAIRGAEFPISFEVEARDDGDVIFILGRTTSVWADLDIRPPNIGRIVQVEDEVKVQILLAARPL